MALTYVHECALPQGLRYYFLRGNTMVPLVPADQLPFQLEGIPRQLTHRQTSDEHWKFLQENNHTPVTLQLQAPTSPVTSPSTPEAKPRYLAPDHLVLKKLCASRAATPKDTPTLLSDPPASSNRKDSLRSGYHNPYPSGIVPDESKKEFCTHWIQTGSCAFVHIGCKYKHEMPAKEKLQELGFRETPWWYQQKPTVRADTWMQARLRYPDSSADESSPPPQFPNPSSWIKGPSPERDV